MKPSQRERAKKALENVLRYPLHVRIAAWLVSNGETYDSMHAEFYVNGQKALAYREVPEPVIANVLNSMRDIQNGTVTIDSTLWALAINGV